MLLTIGCVARCIPHFVFDSLGGKISAFHATWTPGNANTRRITSSAVFSAKGKKAFPEIDTPQAADVS
jgi:hypothetical protein